MRFICQSGKGKKKQTKTTEIRLSLSTSWEDLWRIEIEFLRTRSLVWSTSLRPQEYDPPGLNNVTAGIVSLDNRIQGDLECWLQGNYGPSDWLKESIRAKICASIIALDAWIWGDPWWRLWGHWTSILYIAISEGWKRVKIWLRLIPQAPISLNLLSKTTWDAYIQGNHAAGEWSFDFTIHRVALDDPRQLDPKGSIQVNFWALMDPLD